MILGARGYLGQRFAAAYPGAVAPPVDISDPAAVRRALAEYEPDAVINCAGRCGTPSVDWCESHRMETARGNVLGPMVLLQECGERDIYLVHISSGCIYEGDAGGEGFTEEDAPNFGGSYYSRTKSWIDQIFKEFPVLTLRLRMPFDGSTSDRNLIMKLRKYNRVLVERNSLTHLPDFLATARTLIARRATGIYNVVNPGAMSPYEVMERYRDLVDPSHAFEALPVDQLSEVAKAGRSNCILSTGKLEREGIHLPPVRLTVETSLRALARQLAPTARRPASRPLIAV
jgi:dTDP-4-dehydrorhamnose reductase